MAKSSVQVRKHPLAVGGYLAQLSLNAPRNLNALTLEMVQGLWSRLRSLADDPEAAAVWLDGAGERGFCVGADVRRLRASVLAAGTGRALEAEQFFEIEYRLNHLIHCFPKPVICWGHGVVMGSGLGLLMGASHRIATEDSQLALPEISIGLCPEAGASWFLPRMPGRSGLFCALTGAELNAGDALYAGLADYLLPAASRSAVLAALLELDWQYDREQDSECLTECLTDLEAEWDVCLPESHLKARADLIEGLCASLEPKAINDAFAGLHGDDAWLNDAGERFHGGCAFSARMVLEQFRRCGSLSLADVFRSELVMSANRVHDSEFIEGVRARLLDRDGRPQWRYAQLAEVPAAAVEALFTAPWPVNPLADL